jgi:hypothetical protein
MNKAQQIRQFELFTERMERIINSKRDDYANTDVLSNFKLAGPICQISPQVQCLSLIATKVARLGVLLNSKKKPNNESISDSVIDLANYTFLLDILVKEAYPEHDTADTWAYINYNPHDTNEAIINNPENLTKNEKSNL